jgi:hypothetical protein
MDDLENRVVARLKRPSFDEMVIIWHAEKIHLYGYTTTTKFFAEHGWKLSEFNKEWVLHNS